MYLEYGPVLLHRLDSKTLNSYTVYSRAHCCSDSPLICTRKGHSFSLPRRAHVIICTCAMNIAQQRGCTWEIETKRSPIRLLYSDWLYSKGHHPLGTLHAAKLIVDGHHCMLHFMQKKKKQKKTVERTRTSTKLPPHQRHRHTQCMWECHIEIYGR